MAKLENVKTIDMVNGEITKVEYNGDIYVKVDEGQGTENIGDIVIGKKGKGRDDSYFEIVEISSFNSSRSGKFYDEDDDLDGMFYYEVFRKQSTPSATATLDERVSVLESKVSTLEGETEASAEPAIGGKIKAVKCLKGSTGGFVGWSKLGQGLVKLGDIGEIVERESEGIYAKFPEGGSLGSRERFFLKHGEYEVLGEAVRERITHEGAEYKLVDRKAQPGDVVVFTESTTSYVVNGKTYGPVDEEGEFGDDDGEYIGVYRGHNGRDIQNTKVYEPVAQPLKVGDYAKVVGSSNTFDEEGAIVKIVEDDGTDIPFKNEHLDGSYAGWQDVESLVRATDEEVAEAKAQAEQASVEEKWAKIGRKPNEFKNGDIVRYMGKSSSKGSIVEVAEDSIRGWTKISWENRSGSTEENSELVLITPVESRFDRA